MHPDLYEIFVPRRFILGDFIFVVNGDVVNTAAVDVEAARELADRHG